MLSFIYPDGLPVAMALTAYNAFLTGLAVLIKRRDRAGTLYFVSSITNALWAVSICLMANNHLDAEFSNIAGFCTNRFAFFIPATWLHFVLCYTENEEKLKWLRNLVYTITFLLTPLIFTKHFIPHFHTIVGIRTYPYPGPVFHAFTALFALVVTVSFFLFCYSYQKAQNPEVKRNYQYLGIASFYGFFFGGLSFLPVYGIALPQYNLLLMPLWQILLTYVMIGHQVFDVRQIADAFQREKITALGILAASLNHEMRNPLYIAKGRIEGYRAILETKGTATEEKTEEVISSVSTQLDRTLDIMQRFSDFAKPINTHKDKELFVLGDLIQNVLELVSYALVSQKIEVKVDIEPGLKLRCSRRQLEEVLVNLMTNACQAIKSGAGTGIIELRAKQRKDSVIIEISDNGPGMNANQLAQVFTPFYTTKEKGTGLGLYITKQLIERNGGKIAVKSKLGKGTAFMLEFKV